MSHEQNFKILQSSLDNSATPRPLPQNQKVLHKILIEISSGIIITHSLERVEVLGNLMNGPSPKFPLEMFASKNPGPNRQHRSMVKETRHFSLRCFQICFVQCVTQYGPCRKQQTIYAVITFISLKVFQSSC